MQGTDFILQGHHMLVFFFQHAVQSGCFGADKTTADNKAECKTQHRKHKHRHFSGIGQRKQADMHKLPVQHGKAKKCYAE